MYVDRSASIKQEDLEKFYNLWNELVSSQKGNKMDLRTALVELRNQVEALQTEEDAKYFYKAISALSDFANAKMKLFVQEQANKQALKRSNDLVDKAFGEMNKFVLPVEEQKQLRNL